MASDLGEPDVREKKKDKKDKKRKHEESAAEDGTVVKKEKKSKKRKSDADIAIGHGDTTLDVITSDVDEKEKEKVVIPKAALVAFAQPLAEDKTEKKVLKSVKKGKSCASCAIPLLIHIQLRRTRH